MNNFNFRTGIGIDVHRFAEGRDFFLGGVRIDYDRGLLGHSDADALIHSIMDALLGAAGLPDIGHFFPDNKEEYKNIRSTVLLKKVAEIISEKNHKIANIDCVVCLEAPKIAPYIMEMKNTISRILSIDIEQISIKATTFEKMGFIGDKEGILCISTCLLYK